MARLARLCIHKTSHFWRRSHVRPHVGLHESGKGHKNEISLAKHYVGREGNVRGRHFDAEGNQEKIPYASGARIRNRGHGNITNESVNK